MRGMVRKRHPLVVWLAQTVAMAICALIAFTLVVPVVTVAAAGLLELAAGPPDTAKGRSAVTLLIGIVFMGVWAAMVSVPGLGFTLAGWLPVWATARRHGVFGKWWKAVLCGTVPGMVAMGIFQVWHHQEMISKEGGNPWPWTVVAGSVAGGAFAGALVFGLSSLVAPKKKVEEVVILPGDLTKPEEKKAVEVKAAKVPRGKKKAEKPKWTDWGKVWQPPED